MNRFEFFLILIQMVVNALKIILDPTNLPLLMVSEEGSIKTGIVVACLRKKQKWNLSSIFEEYRRYDSLKVGTFLVYDCQANLDDEQFIELFDPDLVSVDIDKYSFLNSSYQFSVYYYPLVCSNTLF